MVSLEIISDLWILGLTALSAYLLVSRRKPRLMTQTEYDEWLLQHEEETDDESSIVPE